MIFPKNQDFHTEQAIILFIFITNLWIKCPHFHNPLIYPKTDSTMIFPCNVNSKDRVRVKDNFRFSQRFPRKLERTDGIRRISRKSYQMNL